MNQKLEQWSTNPKLNIKNPAERWGEMKLLLITQVQQYLQFRVPNIKHILGQLKKYVAKLE